MGENKVTLNATLNSDGVDAGADATTAKLKRIGDTAADSAARGTKAYNDWQRANDGVNKSIDDGTKSISDQRAALVNLINQIDPAAKAFGRLDSQLQQLKAFKASGAISGDDFNAYTAALGKTRAQMDLVGKSMGGLKFNTSAVRYEIGLLAKDMASGQTANFERSFATLLARTGLLSAAFSGIGPIILGVVAAIGVAAAAFVGAASESDKFNKALVATHGYAGVTVSDLRAMADSIGASTHDYGDAQKALVQLVTSGKFAGDTLLSAGKAAVEMSELTGQSIDKTVAEIVKLAGDPTKVIVELNNQYHFLTQAQYDSIAALQKSGDIMGATTIAVKALADGMDSAKGKMADSAGVVEKAWKLVGNAIADDWNTFKNFVGDIGRSDADAQLDAILKKIMNLKAFMSLGWGMSDSYRQSLQDELTALTNDYNALNKKRNAQNDVTTAEGAYQQTVAKGINSSVEVGKLLADHADKATKLAAAIKNLDNNYDAMWKAQQAALSKDSNAPTNPLLTGVTKTDTGFAGGTYGTALIDLQNEFKDTARASTDAADTMIKNIGAEIAAFGQGKDASERYKVSTMDMTDAQRAEANSLLDILDAWNQYKIITQDAAKGLDDMTKLADQLAVQDEKLKAKVYDQDEAWGQYHVTMQKINDDYAKLLALGPPTEAQQDEYTRAVKNAQAVLSDTHANDYVKKALQEQQSEVKKAAQFWESLANTIATTLTNALLKGGNILKNLGQALVSIMKDIVGQLISTWLKTQIIGMFGSSFGGIGGTLGAGAVQAAATSNIFGGGGSSVTGGSTGASGDAMSLLGAGFSGSSGTGFSLFSPSTWLVAGKNLWSGFMNGSANAGSTFLGSWSGNGSVAQVPSGGLVNLPSGETGVYSPSGVGSAIGIAGGLYAGYNEFNAAGGGAGGVLGGAAYGVGTVALAGGIGSLAAGGGFAAGVAGGMGSIGLGAIPVVGWVALAAMALNMITKGGLFGTSYTPTGNTEQDISVGAGGASVSNSAEESKKGMFFSGRSWKTVPLAVDQATTDAVNKFFDGVKKAVTKGAESLGVAVPDIITGSFKETFDKNGKITSNISTVMGQTYTDTVQQFQERIMAENLIALLPAAQNASVIAQKWRSSADDLLAGAEFLDEAQLDINKNKGLGGMSSLTDIDSVVEDLQTGTETLLDTYVRVQGESTSLQSALDQMGLSIGKTGKDFVEFADQLASDAGGLDVLTQEWNDYFGNFYTKSQQVALQYNNAQTTANAAMSAIGEDPTETFAQFRADFEKALPTLTPDQVQQWLSASEALIALANAGSAVTTQLGADTQTMTNLLQTTQTQVDDLFHGGDTSTQIANLQALIAADPNSSSGYANQAQLWKLQQQQAQQAAGQQALAQATEAAQLLGNLANLSALGGGSLQDLATKFNLPLGDFAKMLGTDSAGLQGQFDTAEKNYEAALKTADNTTEMKEILADLLATQAGTPLPFSQADIAAALGITPSTAPTTSTGPTKIGPPVIGAPPGGGTAVPGTGAVAVPGNNAPDPRVPGQQLTEAQRQTALLNRIANAMAPTGAPINTGLRATRAPNVIPVLSRR